MKKIGITGTIASGKTTVAILLKRMGFPVFNADQYAKLCMFQGKPAYDDVVKVFGKEILDINNEIDRAKLASIVFNNEERRQQLNQIVHPRVREGLLQFFERNDKHNIVVAEVPLLFEAGWKQLFDESWVVTCQKEVAIKRMMEDRDYSYEEALRRYESQIDSQSQIELADIVIYNDTTIVELNHIINQQVKRLRMEERHGIEK